MHSNKVNMCFKYFFDNRHNIMMWDFVSHRATVKLVDKFGVGIDEKVVRWKAEIENMNTTVSVLVLQLCYRY